MVPSDTTVAEWSRMETLKIKSRDVWSRMETLKILLKIAYNRIEPHGN